MINRCVGQFNAWFFDTFDGFINWSLREVKADIYQDLPKEIVEIGPGVGANFGYYPAGARVVAIEPNPEMHRRLISNAETAGIKLDLRSDLAESMSLPSNSSDVVVSNLVLCTVGDPEAVVSEIVRVLRPGGKFVFLEHVRGRGPLMRAIQRIVGRPWRWTFQGCELNRNTGSIIRSAGFTEVDITERDLATVFVPVNSIISGIALK